MSGSDPGRQVAVLFIKREHYGTPVFIVKKRDPVSPVPSATSHQQAGGPRFNTGIP